MRTPLSRPLALTLIVIAALTAARIAAIFATPVELYPDEAQYWLWSRELAWGYFSKPPLVAWLIAASTALGGNDEAWVRLPAALAHAVAALALYGVGERLYDRRTGAAAALLYSLMPGVQLSAGVITTDAPLLMFLALALAAYATLWRGGSTRSRLAAAAALGVALGLACLSKYAALYFLAGLALHAALSAAARRAWSGPAVATAVVGFAVAVAPNLLWNAAHDFSTVSHTAANANWSGGLFNLDELAAFLGAQFGVFGPLPFLVLIGGAVVLARRGRLQPADTLLLSLVVPALVIVTAQAFISRANANWAAAAYVPGSVLVAAWLVRWRARVALGATLAAQGALAAVFLCAVAWPSVAERTGFSGSFKRAKGWAELTRAVEREVALGGWTAVAVDDRFLFNALSYYGRETWALPGAPPLTIWVREARPQNQAETESPLAPGMAVRTLVVSLEPDYRQEIAADFRRWRPLGVVVARLDSRRTREATMYEASGYVRAPRDPRTGRPFSVRPTVP